MPADATGLRFADWSWIKEDLGLGSVTGESTEDDRAKVVREMVSRGYGIPTAFAFGPKLVAHRREWGWDSFDLEWEAKLRPDTDAETFVLRAHDELDLGGVATKLEQRGFDRRDVGAATFLTHAPDPSLATTEEAIANVALIPSEHLILASTREASLHEVIEAHDSDKTLAVDRRLADLGPLFERARSVAIFMGTDTCVLFRPESGAQNNPELIAPMQRELAEAGPLGHYDVLAAGFAPDGGRPVIDFLMRYPSAAEATRDAAGREALARDGTSVRTGKPYDESVMRLLLVVPFNADLLLGAVPADGQAGTIYRAMGTYDMLWAACTE